MALSIARVRAFARALTILLALGFIAPSHLFAQAVGTVRGRVTDVASGRGLADAQVTVVGTRLGAMSGPGGEFAIANVPTGARTLTARRIGYQPASKSVTV